MKFGSWYNRHYKKILVLPILLILFSLAYLFYFYQANGDFLKRDVSLTGGTSLILRTEISIGEFQGIFKETLGDFDLRSLSDNTGKQTHLMILSHLPKEEFTKIIEEGLQIELTEENSSIEFTEGSLGEEFYKQLLTTMLFAFLLMALVVFITFGESKITKVYATISSIIAMKLTFPNINQLGFIGSIVLLFCLFYGLYHSKTKNQRLLLMGLFVLAIVLFFYPYYPIIFLVTLFNLILYTRYSAPSIAVIFAAGADIILTVATVNFLGMKVSSGGIIAFLMLIGYSVGTDVLLTSRVLRRKGESVNQASLGAFKTGFFMTLTAIVSISVGLLFVYRYETVLNQIFTIILIGLIYDLFNTWITNVLIIKWYAEKRDRKK